MKIGSPESLQTSNHDLRQQDCANTGIRHLSLATKVLIQVRLLTRVRIPLINPHDVYVLARHLQLETDGDQVVGHPEELCPAGFAEIVRQHERDFEVWLSRPPCPGWQAVPPNNLPLITVRPRPRSSDSDCVIDYLYRQTDNRPSVLTEWLVRRENLYFCGPGAKWDSRLITYAAARDAACWQLSRNERELRELLRGFVDADEPDIQMEAIEDWP